jgi:hypothetical protein
MPIKKGDKFGNWTVISDSYVQGQTTLLECRCKCGAVKPVPYSNLVNGRTTQCIDCSKAERWKTRRRQVMVELGATHIAKLTRLGGNRSEHIDAAITSFSGASLPENQDYAYKKASITLGGDAYKIYKSYPHKRLCLFAAINEYLAKNKAE